ncbi:hypothetical protein TDB9533_04470 [Thalassocella blandensis]|nr:hypothetical protein TDB9533_04470 [Thalassocella blandensis]
MKTIISSAVKVLAPAALFACLTPNAFAETQYKSAMFNFAGDTLVSQVGSVAALKSQNQTHVLYCQSDISDKGAASNTQCYDKAGKLDVVNETQTVLNQLAFLPAEVDGQQVPVRMSYRVAFHSAKGNIEALLIPNLGTMYERYGRDYVAPQERLDVANWYEEYSKNSWVSGDQFLGEGDMSRIAATVNESGKADMVRTLDTGRAYKRDANLVKNAVKKSRFIPGFVNGKPVPMGYVAVVNYQTDSGTAVTSR